YVTALHGRAVRELPVRDLHRRAVRPAARISDRVPRSRGGGEGEAPPRGVRLRRGRRGLRGHGARELRGLPAVAHRSAHAEGRRGEELCRSCVQRAEKRGYDAIVVTLDATILAWRPRDLQAACLPFLLMEGVANYVNDPVLQSRLEKPPEEDVAAAVMAWGSV